MSYDLTLPLTQDALVELSYGTRVSITGTLIVGGPEVQREIVAGKELPEGIPEGSILVHCRPLLVRKGRKWAVRSLEPDRSAPYESAVSAWLARRSIRAFLGYGGFSTEALEWFHRLSGCYLEAFAGTGPVLAEYVTSVNEIPFAGLKGPDALWAMEVEEFPAVVTMDMQGNSLYEMLRSGSTRNLTALLG